MEHMRRLYYLLHVTTLNVMHVTTLNRHCSVNHDTISEMIPSKKESYLTFDLYY